MENGNRGIFASEGITVSDRILHTAGAFAKKNLLYVQETGVLESLVPHICRREHLDSYLIMEVLEGKGTVVYENRTYDLHKGECVWIDCALVFEHISSAQEPWKLAWIHFNGNRARAFYELFQTRNQSPVFLPADVSVVQKLLEQILDAVKSDVSEMEIHSLLTQLVAACVRPLDEKSIMKDVREYIHENFNESGLVQTLCERFHMSGQEMETLFSGSFGIGLRDYILSRRFNAAKERLRFTIHPMEEVIVESGIGNEDLFYQLFRENENMTPQEYRINWAQWIKD